MCAFVNEPGEKFCGGCGRQLEALSSSPLSVPPSRGERRPVTILFADLAGYTRLSSSLDPEETHRLLERFFEVADGAVMRFGGSIDKHIGDNVMGIFGAPIAHGNDPERAVRAAIEIHAAAAELSEKLGVSLRVHIGIASGEVMASGLGSSHHQEYTMTGDAVNLAARLQDRATAGETLISDKVYRATESLALFEAVGEISLKGLPKPVRVWKVVGLRTAPAAAGRRAFVGRRSELRHIQAVLEGCIDEGRGAAISLRGEAGLGKTRLLAEVCSAAAHLGFRSQGAQVLDFGTGAAGGAVQTLCEGLLGVAQEADEGARRAAVTSAVQAELLAADLAPSVLDLIAVPALSGEPRGHIDLDNSAHAELRLQAVADLVERAAGRQPLLVAVEDIHWADRFTLRVLSRLAKVVSRCRAVLLLTTRVEGDPLDERFRADAEHSPLLRIDLAPLRDEEALALAAEVSVEIDGFAQRCIERASGNPLFLEQLLEGRENGEHLPETVSSLVLARLDRLPPVDKQALQVASVLGQRFELDVLRALLAAEPPVGDRAARQYDAAELRARQLLRAEGQALLFQHALFRDAVYASLTRTRREELHRRAAECYAERDAVLHAEHLELGGQPAAMAYARAARELAASFHFERAGSLLEHAMHLTREAHELYELGSARGQVAIEAGAAKAAIDAYQRAIGSASTDEQRARALIGLASAYRQTSSYEPMLAALQKAEPIATSHDLAEQRARIHYLRGSAYFALGRSEACLREHELALEQAERLDDPEWRARAQSGLGDAYYAQARLSLAGEHYARCVEICEAHGFERYAAPNRLMFAMTELFRGEFALGIATARRALGTVERTRDHATRIFAHHILAMITLFQGQYEAARREGRLALETAQRTGARRFEAEGMLLVALAEDALGLGAQAERLAEEAVESARDVGMAFCGPMALGALAAISTNREKVLAALREGERLVSGGTLAHNSLWFALLGLRAALREADEQLLDHFAGQLLEAARRDRLPLCELCVEAVRLEAQRRRDPSDASIRERCEALHERARSSGLELKLVLGAAAGGLPN